MSKPQYDAPKNLKKTSRRLLKLLMQQKSRFSLIIISAFLFSITMAIAPLFLGWGLDNVIALMSQKNWQINDLIQALKLPLIFLVMSWLFISGFSLLQEFTMASVSETLTLALRKEITAKFNRLPIRFFDQYQTGDILSRTILDLDKVSEVLQVGLMQLIVAILSIISGIIVMLYLSPLLTLAIIGILLVSVFATKYLSQKNLIYFTDNQVTLGNVTSRAEELYSANLLIKSYNQKETVTKEMEALSEAQFKAFRKAQFLSYAINPFIRFINQIGFVLSAVFGGFMILNGQLSIGLIQAYLQYVNQISEPITQASYITNTLQSALASLERIFEILDYPEEIEIDSPQVVPEKIDGHVVFENLSFGYTPEKLLMENINITVKPQQKVAIVGPTGAGKTTLINLLMRFYPLNQGTIYLDGQDMTSYQAADIRKRFGMVLQDTWLFEGSIAENIGYGNPQATPEDIIQASRAAQCDYFIRTLPDGYDTKIGGETDLSQGQQQLLTIARAILANPTILILDEATSSVDTRTELMIQQAMNELTKNRTSFVIAHRLSTIKNADLILVMKDGTIIEQGSHDELLSQPSFYANLYQSQFQGSETGVLG